MFLIIAKNSKSLFNKRDLIHPLLSPAESSFHYPSVESPNLFYWYLMVFLQIIHYNFSNLDEGRNPLASSQTLLPSKRTFYLSFSFSFSTLSLLYLVRISTNENICLFRKIFVKLNSQRFIQSQHRPIGQQDRKNLMLSLR